MNNNEWIKINLPYGPIYNYKKSPLVENYELDSFCKRKINKSGVLIEMEDGSQYLIGDINELCGVCDDCTAFDRESIVKKYKVVWEKK